MDTHAAARAPLLPPDVMLVGSYRDRLIKYTHTLLLSRSLHLYLLVLEEVVVQVAGNSRVTLDEGDAYDRALHVGLVLASIEAQQ
jgi:hypothetical protein